MPIIGRPETPNNFAEVSMGPRKSVPKEAVGQAVERLGLGEKKAEFFKDAKNHNKMGKDEFLKLLSFQLQNQDPMNPMDQTKFAGELAQFSQLEQLANMRTAIEGSTKNDAIEEKYLAASFLGKRVLTEGNQLDLKPNSSAPVNFSLDEKAKVVMVRIMDAKGGMVAEVRQENLAKGNHQLSWDGLQFDGYRAQNGKYNVQVLAYDEVHRPVRAVTKASGLVEAVSFENGEAVLTVDGKKVDLKSIDKVELPSDINSKKDMASSLLGPKTNGENSQGTPRTGDINPQQVSKSYQAQANGLGSLIGAEGGKNKNAGFDYGSQR